MIDYVLPNTALVDAFGGFITSISAAYSAEKQKKDGLNRAAIKSKLWPLVFIVNELFHTTKYHMRDRLLYDECVSTLRIPVIALLKDLSQFQQRTNQKHFKRLSALLAFWHRQDFFDKGFIQSLKTLVESEGQQLPAESKDFATQKQKRGNGESDAPRKRKKVDPTKGIQVLGGIDNIDTDGEWKLPEWHGGENTPWHLLPAASWLRPLHITDHDAGQGMRKRDFRAIKFKADPVARQVRKEVLKLLKEADEIYAPTSNIGKRIEYDQMGRKMEVIKIRRGVEGKVKKYVKRETYYGWSPSFLDEMYKWPEKGFLSKLSKRRSASASYGSSPPSRRSYSPAAESTDQVRSYEPPVVPFQHHQPPPFANAGPHPLPPQQSFQPGYAAPPPPPPPMPWMQGRQPFPPPPAGYNAPWPPPPPPAQPQHQGPSPQSFPAGPHGQNGWASPLPPPPPPPPPPPMGSHQGFNGGFNNQQGRGSYRGNFGGYNNRGNRGGYGRGGY